MINLIYMKCVVSVLLIARKHECLFIALNRPNIFHIITAYVDIHLFIENVILKCPVCI